MLALLTFGITLAVAFNLPKGGPHSELVFIAVWIVAAFIIGSLFMGIRDSCPHCKKMGTLDEKEKILESQQLQVSKGYEVVTHRNKKWHPTGYSEVPVERTTAKNV